MAYHANICSLFPAHIVTTEEKMMFGIIVAAYDWIVVGVGSFAILSLPQKSDNTFLL